MITAGLYQRPPRCWMRQRTLARCPSNCWRVRLRAELEVQQGRASNALALLDAELKQLGSWQRKARTGFLDTWPCAPAVIYVPTGCVSPSASRRQPPLLTTGGESWSPAHPCNRCIPASIRGQPLQFGAVDGIAGQWQ